MTDVCIPHPSDLIAQLPDDVRDALVNLPLSNDEREILWCVKAALPATKQSAWDDILWRRLQTHLPHLLPVLTTAANRPATSNLQEASIVTKKNDTPSRGTFTATATKQPGDNKPGFRGTMTLPGDGAERTFVLWARRTQNNSLVLSGHTRETAGLALANIAAMADGAPKTHAEPVKVGNGANPVTVKPRDIILFQNPDRSERRPEFYGYHHTGEDRPPLSVAVWLSQDADGTTRLSGFTQDTKIAQNQAQSSAHPQNEAEPIDDCEPDQAP